MMRQVFSLKKDQGARMHFPKTADNLPTTSIEEPIRVLLPVRGEELDERRNMLARLTDAQGRLWIFPGGMIDCSFLAKPHQSVQCNCWWDRRICMI